MTGIDAQRRAKPGEVLLWGLPYRLDSPEVSSVVWGMVRAADRAIAESGYSVDELARIEFAFESVPLGEDRMFKGLMAVVDVLSDIHGVDLSVKEESKMLFVVRG